MLIALFNNLPELILGAMFATVMFWLGRKSVGFRPFQWVKSWFVKG